MARVKLFINGTQKTVVHASLEKQGDRSIDQLKVMLPANVGVEVNDKILYLQDFVDVYNLSAVYNFQNSVKDESGNLNHGTATDVTFAPDSWDGYGAVFNGTSSKITIPDDNSIDLSGEFHIYIWAKWTSTSSGSLFSRSPLKINVNATTAGDVKVLLNTDAITSSTAGYNDGNWHLVEIKRVGTLVTLSIDDVSKGTVTSNVDLSASTSYEVGHESSAGYFNGSISRLRIYKGDTLSAQDSTKIFSKRNPRSTLKFGGYVTKIENVLSQKDVIAQSFGKALGETEVRSTVYDDKSPEYIVNDLISNNTTFSFTTGGANSGLVMSRYTADGKLIDIIRDLATLTNSIFFTTGSEELFFVPKSFTETSIVFTHGTDSKINKSGFDDTEIVNDLTVLGENKKYETTELISSNGNDLEYVLERNAVSIKVKVGGAEKTPDEDYTLDSLGRTLTFTTAPASGTDNISAEYTYELPLYFRGQRASSIEEYGVHAKRLNMSWINNRTDGIRFINSYLNRYKDITEKIMIELGYFFNAVEEGDIVQVINSVKEISGDFMVKSITWDYPSMTTKIEVGEYYFGFFESDKQIVQKIHDLEGAVTANKTLIDFESPEEVLPEITDAIIQIVSQNFTESLSITQSDTIREMQAGSYGATRYGSRRLPLTVNNGSVYTSG
tara:strand:- start:2467 stop:4470 length:2004 start_codon:yes stop_codon:yes gene_type:complete